VDRFGDIVRVNVTKGGDRNGEIKSEKDKRIMEV
jgi:hypothetical protein